MESLSEFLENLGYMTFSHEGFWAVLAVVVAVVVIYQLLGAFAPKTIAPVRGFFKRHPLVWLLIPAAAAHLLRLRIAGLEPVGIRVRLGGGQPGSQLWLGRL